MSPPYRMLVSKNAKAVYTRELEGVPYPLRLVVVIVDARVTGQKFRDVETENLSVAMEYAEREGDNIAVAVTREEDPQSPTPRVPRGSPLRLSPMTPFAVLHRMYDAIIAGNGSSMAEIMGPFASTYSDLYKANKDLEFEAATLARDTLITTGRFRSANEHMLLNSQILSVGVETAAGRMGVLGDPTQVLADLFALRSKTGRWGYNCQAQPNIKGPDYAITAFSPKMMAARQAFSDTGVEFISDLISGLKWGGYAFSI